MISSKSDKLEVLYILLAYPVRSERFISREIHALRQLGVSIQIATIGSGEGEPAEPSDVETAVWRRPTGGSAHPLLFAAVRALGRPRALKRLLGAAFALAPEEARWGRLRALRWAAVALYFAQRVRDNPPSVIHAHFANAPASVALLLSAWLGRRWGFSVHARDLYTQGVDFTLKVSQADHVLSCSETSTQDLLSKLPRELHHRVHTVHHGIDLAEWNPNGAGGKALGTPLILAVGRFEPKKGFSVLIEACGRLRNAGFPVHCELIGDGREKESLENQIEAAGLRDNVRILPWCSPAVLKEHYARAWALAVPSVIAADGDRDNIPNVVIEALGSGVPVVASALPAIAAVLEPSGSASLVPPRDAKALADALREVCSNPELSQRLRSNGRELATQRFNSLSNVRRIRSLLLRPSMGG
jgi:glycosyltransferase involved in cell wall biosynthesis